MLKTSRVGLPAISLAILIVILFATCKKPALTFKCTDSIGCVHIKPDEVLKIGVLQTLSGSGSSLGIDQVRGIELAIDECHGKLMGHSILLQIEDTGCTAEGGANAALKVVADSQAVAVLGTTCSGAAVTASKIVSDAGLVMISGNNSSPYLTSIAGKRASYWQPGYFRTASNEEYSGKVAAMFAFQKLGIRKAATINDGDAYTLALTDGFKTEFQYLGGEIVLSGSISKGDKEMQPVLTAVVKSGAQILFFPLFQPEGNLVLLQARKIPAFHNIVLMSDGALLENSFIDSVGDDSKGMYFVGPFSPSGTPVEDMDKKFLLKYKLLPDNPYYLDAYDAASLLFHAIEAVAVQEPDGSLYIGRQVLRDMLYNTKEFKGITGSLTCNEFGDCADPVFNILQMHDTSNKLKGLLSNIIFTHSATDPDYYEKKDGLAQLQ